MKHFWIIGITCVVFGKVSVGEDVDLRFPSNFVIGTATASGQVEGAWNIGGKSENIWDRWTHQNPNATTDGRNADIACDSYHKYKEDVQLIKSIGLKFYRFSISWSRVLPNGFANEINHEGIQYYKNLTAELVKNGIEPIVTLYHWDHPQTVEDMGGWTNEVIVDMFADYARIMFRELGHSVKIWVTINEPISFCFYGYEENTPQIAPGKKLNGYGGYLCGHNVLKAHAKTYRMYDEEFRAIQRGQIGMANPCQAYIPVNSNDTVSVETAFQFNCGWMAHPVYIGDYPEIMKKRVAMVSKSQGFSKSRLPKFTNAWISYIKGTADFYGLNHYTSFLVSPDPDEALGKYNSDAGLEYSYNSSWSVGASSWLYVNPSGLGDVLREISAKYNNPPVWVMENGYSDYGELEDYGRISYHHDYLKELLIAVNRDGCNVKGYSIWSIMDNFEWYAGYSVRFGITWVDFDDPDRKRIAKLSTSWWDKVIKDSELQPALTKNDSIYENLRESTSIE